MASCKKDSGADSNPAKSGTTNFTRIGTAGSSAAIITWFATNRKGNAFIVTVIDENATRQTYAGNGTTWEKLGAFQPADAAVSESGVIVYFDNQNLLRRYSGSGSPEAIAPGNLNYPKVTIGRDGNFYAGSFNGSVYKSADDGKTWMVTAIPQNRFNYSGNLAVGFLVHPDGKMYSYLGGGRFYQSIDAGKTWTDVNINIDKTSIGYNDIYSPVSHDHNGYVYMQGASGVAIVNTTTMTSRSVSFQTAGLPAFEKFATDEQGVLYAGSTNLGFDYENRKQGAALHKYSGSAWQRLPLPGPYAGFSAMSVQATKAGIVSAANGLMSKGLYAIDANGKYTAIGAPQQYENVILNMAPHNNGKVFCAVRHATPIGTVMGAALNPAYPSLLLLENGQWKHTGLSSDGAFVASNGDIYSIENVFVNVSKDGGTTWQTSTIAVDDPLNLRNFMSAEPLHFTELKGRVHVYFQLGFGGVGGAYANYSWTKASLGSPVFDKLANRAANYDPASTRIPLATAAKGTTGFYYNPFNGFAYYPARENAAYLTTDGGSTYSAAGSILPFSGSNSGYYVAYGVGKFVVSGPGNPLDFSAINLKLPEGEIDMNRYNGVNYFKTWARFGVDNKLYLNLDNKIYMSDKAF
ncbi:hypothetical protein GCM10011379_48880 [Filimonas zeae]|uniref:Uncharacterized protein n=1 Tax=Filimonas zeae TaxID=1737353 RepID=A0A917J483_9BACT|nr:hypothetical protein GCM10011379_48880 [Filimonas zeae]